METTDIDCFVKTYRLTAQIVKEVKEYVERRKLMGSYSYRKFLDEVQVSYLMWNNMQNGIANSIPIDTVIRILDKCGLRLRITEKIMPIEMYDHKDIIPPTDYEADSE